MSAASDIALAAAASDIALAAAAAAVAAAVATPTAVLASVTNCVASSTKFLASAAVWPVIAVVKELTNFWYATAFLLNSPASVCAVVAFVKSVSGLPDLVFATPLDVFAFFCASLASVNFPAASSNVATAAVAAATNLSAAVTNLSASSTKFLASAAGWPVLTVAKESTNDLYALAFVLKLSASVCAVVAFVKSVGMFIFVFAVVLD